MDEKLIFDTEKMMKIFGERLKTHRKKKHMTQDEAGYIFDVAPSTIGAYERGTRQPTMETLIKMSRYFNVSLDYLMGESEDERSLANFQREDSKELKDFLVDQSVMFNGIELSQIEKQRVMDILTGLFWNNISIDKTK